MSEFPSGVAVITAMDDQGQPWGMTCSALCSLCADPPTLLCCLRATSVTLARILQAGYFPVNLLHSQAQDTAALFGSGFSTPTRFDDTLWQGGAAGPHITEDAHAIADCRLIRTVEGGTHTILFGEVFDIAIRDGFTPLLHGRRRYSSWPDH
jgi:flavin reductase (DIM6/NTAB) family NADH-FMN oxidoreductase RutF